MRRAQEGVGNSIGHLVELIKSDVDQCGIAFRSIDNSSLCGCPFVKTGRGDIQAGAGEVINALDAMRRRFRIENNAIWTIKRYTDLLDASVPELLRLIDGPLVKFLVFREASFLHELADVAV